MPKAKEEKKIGILTVHHSVNFGATLQAFASNRFLRKKGYAAEVVDYRQHSLETDAHLKSNLRASWVNDKNRSFTHRMKLASFLILTYPQKARRYRRFAEFRKNYMNLSEACSTGQEIARQGYTHIVCGSDQIWNPAITGGLDPIFFANFPGEHKKIAFAASMGAPSFSPGNLPLAMTWINALDACSVREIQTQEYLSGLVSIPVVQILDPVFLLEKEDYDAIMAPSKIKEPYVLLYSAVSNEAASRAAEEFAKKRGLQLIEIRSGKKLGAAHKLVCDIGPSEFLRYIADAAYVLTNSFHGTAFSILLEKNFLVIDNKARGSRITDLLQLAGLTDRLTEDDTRMFNTQIDYSAVETRLNAAREHSRSFLLNALEE